MMLQTARLTAIILAAALGAWFALLLGKIL
jgi:hypothetical protein